MQIGAHKSAKKTFALSDFVLLVECRIERLVLNKNAKKPFVAICFGFRDKMFSLTGLYVSHLQFERSMAYTVCHTPLEL